MTTTVAWTGAWAYLKTGVPNLDFYSINTSSGSVTATVTVTALPAGTFEAGLIVMFVISGGRLSLRGTPV